jgi:hypothetical protein
VRGGARRHRWTSGRPTDDDDEVAAPTVATGHRSADATGPAARREERTFQAPRPYASAPKMCCPPNWDASSRGAPYACVEDAGLRVRVVRVLDAREGVATREVPKRVCRACVEAAASSRPSRARSARRPGSRPRDGQSSRRNDAYLRPATPRGQRAADRRGEGSGTAPILRIWSTDRERFWRSTRRITAVFRGSKLYARPSDTPNAARAATGQPGAVYALRELSGSCRSIGGV